MDRDDLVMDVVMDALIDRGMIRYDSKDKEQDTFLFMRTLEKRGYTVVKMEGTGTFSTPGPA